MSEKKPAGKRIQKKDSKKPSTQRSQIQQKGVEGGPQHLAESQQLSTELPVHPTTRRLRQETLLQLQRRYGNDYVQRLLNEQDAGPDQANDPHVVQAELGSGQSLDNDVRSRMESSFGTTFTGVRVHTGSKASRMAAGRDARAFTVGEHIAFDAGEYQPGNPLGEALIAHELAHVAQQRGTNPSVAAMKTGTSAEQALEADADESARSALMASWTGAQGKTAEMLQSAMPRLRSGLAIRSCKRKKVAEKAKKEPKLLTDFAAKFSGAADLIRTSPEALKLVEEAAKAKVAFGGYAEEGPSKDAWPYTVGSTVYVPKASTDKVKASSDFLFELNNAVRKSSFASIDKKAKEGSITAEQYAYKTVEQEVEGMLRTGKIWAEMKEKSKKGVAWNKYDADFFLGEYKAYKAGKKTKDDLVKDVLKRKYTSGVDAGKTVEQYYKEQYKAIKGGG